MNEPAVIPYGRTKRVRYRFIIAIIVIVCGASYLLCTYVPRLVDAVGTRYWLWRVKNFSRPADEIVYTDDELGGMDLRHAKSNYKRASDSDREITYRAADERDHLGGTDVGTSWGIIVLHKIPSDGRLICCFVAAKNDVDYIGPVLKERFIVLQGVTFPSNAANGGVRARFTRDRPVHLEDRIAIELRPNDQVTIFSGQASADGESFTFDLKINQKRYTIDVSHDAAGQVYFHPRQGTFTPSTSPNTMNIWDPNE